MRVDICKLTGNQFSIRVDGKEACLLHGTDMAKLNQGKDNYGVRETLQLLVDYVRSSK